MARNTEPTGRNLVDVAPVLTLDGWQWRRQRRSKPVERLERRIVNNNETILKIDLHPTVTLRTPQPSGWVLDRLCPDCWPRWTCEVAHSDPSIGKIPDQAPSMPTMLDPSMAPEGIQFRFFAPTKLQVQRVRVTWHGWTDEIKQSCDRVVDKLAEYAPNVKNLWLPATWSPAERERLERSKVTTTTSTWRSTRWCFSAPARIGQLQNHQGLFLTARELIPAVRFQGCLDVIALASSRIPAANRSEAEGWGLY